ncbi:MAG: dihydroorotase [Verrucomicrobiota bacterium]
MATLYRGGDVAAEDADALMEADVLVEGDVIAQVGKGLEAPEGAAVVECAGKIVMPAMFDVHVHLREPGQEGKETIRTGSEAAINGGVTGIVAMPNTIPAIDNGGMIQAVLDIAESEAGITVHTTGCITKDRAGKELAEIADMRAKGAVMITDDGSPVGNPLVLRRALEYAREFDLIVASHCETMELSGSGAMNEGTVSYKLGLAGWPACSEEICLDRDIRLAQYTGSHVHIQHVTTARGMETIRRFKEDGVRVTCEVSPHHLIFNEAHVGEYDTHYKMNPPLRTAEDNARLLDGLREGVFDVIATDHAPHTAFEKRQDFASAPFGITGLETALPSLYHYFVKEGTLGWDLIVKRYSAEPRRLLGLDAVSIEQGQRAELLVFDPARETVFTKEFMKSKSSNTPFLDQALSGMVVHVRNGEEVLIDR